MEKSINIRDLKLKHIDLISSDEIDFKKIMVEVFGYKNTLIEKLFFKNRFVRVFDILTNLRNLEFESIDDLSKCKIRYPKSIDSISFQARLEISNLSNNSVLDLILNTITLSCYTTHHKVVFNSDSELYNDFKNHVLNQPLIDMIALYNHISKEIEKSEHMWKTMFDNVQVIDLDYEEAGGNAIMSRFNLLSISKKLVQDFNVSRKEAFLLPFNLVQMNSLEEASRNYVQDRLTTIKERNFKMKRNKHE